MIPSHVLTSLGAGLRGSRVAQYADGRSEEVGITQGIIFQVMGRDTLEEALVLGDEVLLGQTFLEATDLLADCTSKRLMPNLAHPDQPVLKVK